MAKGFSKSFIGMLYTLRVILPSLTALSRTFQTGSINFPRITPNIEKTKFKLQQILHEQKPLMLLKTDLKNRLQRYNLKGDKQLEKPIHSITERCTKAML